MGRIGSQVDPGTAFWRPLDGQVGPGMAVSRALGRQVGPGMGVQVALGRQVDPGMAFKLHKSQKFLRLWGALALEWRFVRDIKQK